MRFASRNCSNRHRSGKLELKTSESDRKKYLNS